MTFVFHSFPGDGWDIVMPITHQNARAIPGGMPKGAQNNVKRFKKYLRKKTGGRKDPFVRASVNIGDHHWGCEVGACVLKLITQWFGQ